MLTATCGNSASLFSNLTSEPNGFEALQAASRTLTTNQPSSAGTRPDPESSSRASGTEASLASDGSLEGGPIGRRAVRWQDELDRELEQGLQALPDLLRALACPAVRPLDREDEAVAAIGQKSLIDVRSPDEFAGRLLAPAHLPQEQAQRGGHIPTAVNVPWSKAANDDGTFKSDDDLKTLYGDAGLDFGRDIIAYCRIGERSAHTWFVLHELLDQQNVKNYDGSWTEYGSLVGVPIAVGDEPGEA